MVQRIEASGPSRRISKVNISQMEIEAKMDFFEALDKLLTVSIMMSTRQGHQEKLVWDTVTLPRHKKRKRKLFISLKSYGNSLTYILSFSKTAWTS